MAPTGGTPSIPGSIRAGVVTYRVTTDSGEWLEIEHRTQTSGYYGHTEHHGAVIYLNPALGAEVMRLTLWHEVMHALAEVAMGSPDWTKLGKSKKDREESVIRHWEHPVVAVLRDNPELVAYLTA